MKKKFNILCVTMFAVIILYIAGGFTYSGVIAYHMIKQAAGMTVTDKEKLKNDIEIFDNTKYTLCTVSMIPYNIFGNKETTIENTLTGEQTQIMPVKSMIFVKGANKTSWATDTAMTATGLIVLVADIFFLCSLIMFIRNVRRHEIFEWKNVKLLRRMGTALIAIFILSVMTEWILCAVASGIFAPKRLSHRLVHPREREYPVARNRHCRNDNGRSVFLRTTNARRTDHLRTTFT